MEKIEVPSYAQSFVAVDYFEALYTTKDGEQALLIDSRTWVTATSAPSQIYTMIDGQPIQARNVVDLFLLRDDCLSLSITHIIPILWNDAARKGELVESFLPPPIDSPYKYSVKLSLTVDGITYNTPEHEDSLSDAIYELYKEIKSRNLGVECRFMICIGCKFATLAFTGPLGDRDDYRCYRDSPEAFEEVNKKGFKFASRESQYAGAHFINAFHRCAAWKPKS